MADSEHQFVIPFSKIEEDLLDLVGSKGLYLGKLLELKIPVPNGFVITTNAFEIIKKTYGLEELITKEMQQIDPSDGVRLENAAKRIRSSIIKAGVHKDIKNVVERSYGSLSGFTDSYVAIRSSSPIEDLKNTSYSGQFSTYLNVKGKDDVIDKVLLCWSSLFTPQNLFYSLSKGYNVSTISMAVVVQKMVQAEVSGLLFTVNPVDNDPSKMSIEAVLGLGEALTTGQITPDTYVIDKETDEILEKHIVPQEWMLVRKGRTKRGEDPNVKVKVSTVWKSRQKLENKYIQKLTKIGKKLNEKWSEAQDIEWVYEGGKVWIVQARPMKTYIIDGSQLWKKTPTFAALQAKMGSQKSQQMPIKAEKNIPNIKIKQKKEEVETQLEVQAQPHNVHVAEKETKKDIYEPPIEEKEKKDSKVSEPPKEEIKTATKVYVAIHSPREAQDASSLGTNGVGICDVEDLIIQNGVHPQFAVKTKEELQKYYNAIGVGIYRIAKAFEGRPVIYKLSDILTNTRAQLANGDVFETHEVDEKMGYHGAFRMLEIPEVVKLELKCIRTIRNKEHLRNIWLALPCIRTVRELREMKHLISSAGFRRSTSFKLFLMVDMPSIALRIEKALDIGIDGVILNLDVLGEHTLGFDRENVKMKEAYPKVHTSVQQLSEHVLRLASKAKVNTLVYGEKTSLTESLIRKMIEWGANGVIVPIDTYQEIRSTVSQAEKAVILRKRK